jgi:hypothetical protein
MQLCRAIANDCRVPATFGEDATRVRDQGSKKRASMRWCALIILAVGSVLQSGCGTGGMRGIADKRSDFRRFLAMEGDASRYGLRAVRPYFQRANRTEILRAIEGACTGGKEGSSAYNPETKAGYYVNCNPRNRQLLNGYVPVNPRVRPHSNKQ